MTLKAWDGTGILTQVFMTIVPRNFRGGVGLGREALKRRHTSKEKRQDNGMVKDNRTGGFYTSGESLSRENCGVGVTVRSLGLSGWLRWVLWQKKPVDVGTNKKRKS